MTAYRPLRSDAALQGPYILDRTHPINRGLKVFLPLEGNQRLVNLADPANDATFLATRPEWIPTRCGITAPDFVGGVQNQIGFGNEVLLDVNQPFTLAAWLDFRAFSSGNPTWCVLKANATEDVLFFFGNFGSYPGLNWGNSSGTWSRIRTFFADGSQALGHKLWVLRYNGGGDTSIANWSLRINNVETALTGSGTFGTFNVGNSLGYINSSNVFDGTQSWFRFWRRELSDSDCDNLYRLPTRWDGVIPVRERYRYEIGEVSVTPPTGFQPWYSHSQGVAA